MFDFILLIITGLSVGFISSFLGIGGGALIVPTLLSLYPGLAVHSILSISLGIIFLNTILNIFNWRSDKVLPPPKSALMILLGCIAGVSIGSLVLYEVDEKVLKKVFASVLLIIAFRTLLMKPKSLNSQASRPKILLFTASVIGSFISSITGLGGGVIYVPMYLELLKLPMKNISPYSNVSMLFASLFGLIPHLLEPLNISTLEFPQYYKDYFIGHVNIAIVLVVFTGSYITSKIGTRLNSSINQNIKKIALGLLLLIVSVKMFIV